MRQGLLDDRSAVKLSLTAEHRIDRDSPDISARSARVASHHMAMRKASAAACGLAAVSLFAPALTITPTVAAAPRECAWRLGPDLVLIQDNGLTVEGSTKNNQVVGPIRYAHTGGDDWTTGTLDGPAGLTGDGSKFHMKVNWTQGPGAGTSNTYDGNIGADKRVLGSTTNNVGATTGWILQYSAFCDDPPIKDLEVTPGEPLGTPGGGGAPGPGAAPKAPTEATVVADTDIYDKPDGKGQKIGTLSVGETHPLMEPCRDDWCRVGQIELGGFEGLPNGTAWVYAKGFLTFS
jgi:hypothetical protein